MNIKIGMLNESDVKIGIIASRFNEVVVSKLIDGAADALDRHGVDMESVDLVWVPGAFEIPVTAKKMAESNKYDAIICLGAVVRGETDHYEHVATEVTKGIASVSLNTGMPVLYGILTTDTVEQAINRAGMKSGNKGFECAVDALEMINLFKNL
ncbi:6,7-dimethyl-8-ribityllumazine synthase [Dialister micraerophilus]|uniref:6,7-dimethyl-8-ribityllumazine synthase n=1 Tax=Dialister micraerophilus DSM 19965 TaxID=888062 RepID=F2BY90_9FIRM|nr:6,7-dimethyl-8-ribityllumazine synthase [Dialister micraerophilus]EGF12411.1 6,7-dimethyl-8-ribityllumazine synthase (riboflavin synthase beta chain) [Dialister micraerophilus DSM 19965]MDK8285200.1 6,7-dimethyl-8-ribityllumazine synthase [Dialister micraerophilus]